MESTSLSTTTILVTGGTGSFGKKFVSEVLERYDIKKVIIYSRDELKQSEMQSIAPFCDHADKLRYFIGDIRDLSRLKMAFSEVDYVIHAAALKQVPALEYNPFEAVKTNIIGAQNVVEAAISRQVRKVIALSTDKAAAPVNLYGATKLASDKLILAANNLVGRHRTRFSVVRYGNVFGSRGSVVPFFLRMQKRRAFPVTDQRMTRFSITLSEGVEFVIRCLTKSFGGELFVPKIPSYRITDLTTTIDPEKEVEIVGIRPGEKLHEEMITNTDSMSAIECDDHFVILPSTAPPEFDKSLYLDNGYKHCPEGFHYSSDSNGDFLSVSTLEKLVRQYQDESLGSF